MPCGGRRSGKDEVQLSCVACWPSYGMVQGLSTSWNGRARVASLGLLGRAVAWPAFQLHAQRQSHAGEDLFDFLERLATEVLGLEHVGLGLLHELADVADVG